MNLQCEYVLETIIGFPNQLYLCDVSSASITSIEDRLITSFIGVHKDGKSDEDVEGVRFKNTVVEFFPRGLQVFFPHLAFLSVYNCELKEITRNDLKDLNNLEVVYLRYNLLEKLPNNLFEDMPKLKSINFYGNKLKFVTSKLLKPIKNNGLTYVNFCYNTNIDALYAPGNSRSVATIEKLMKKIDGDCDVPEEEIGEDEDKETYRERMSQGFGDLLTSGKFSDFKIIVEEKEFPVHKNILSVHSLVCAKIFAEKNNHANEVKIENISVDAVEDFLRYLYTGKRPKPESAIEAFALASRFKVNELISICERIICKSVLKNSNAFNVFMLGHRNASDKLKLAAFKEIKSSFPADHLSDNLMQDPENLKRLVELKSGVDELLEKFKIV